MLRSNKNCNAPNNSVASGRTSFLGEREPYESHGQDENPDRDEEPEKLHGRLLSSRELLDDGENGEEDCAEEARLDRLLFRSSVFRFCRLVGRLRETGMRMLLNDPHTAFVAVRHGSLRNLSLPRSGFFDK